MRANLVMACIEVSGCRTRMTTEGAGRSTGERQWRP